MVKNKMLIGLLSFSMVSAVTLAGCSGTPSTPTPGTSVAPSAVSSIFNVMGVDGTTAVTPDTGKKQGFEHGIGHGGCFGFGEGFGKGFGMGMGMDFLNKIKLTADQKAKLKALEPQDQPKPQINKDAAGGFQTAFQDFLSDKIDKDALKAKLTPPVNQDDQIKKMAQHILDVYNILTPDQKTQVKTLLNTPEPVKSPLNKDWANKKPQQQDTTKTFGDKLGLALTDAQKTQLQDLFKPNTADMKANMDKMKAIKTAVINELETGTTTVDKIVAILQGIKPLMDAGINTRIDNLVKFHDILTADQRQKLVTNMQNQANTMKQKAGQFKGKMPNKGFEKKR